MMLTYIEGTGDGGWFLRLNHESGEFEYGKDGEVYGGDWTLAEARKNRADSQEYDEGRYYEPEDHFDTREEAEGLR